jgi:4-amino-4-deoxy-L-arabinose transferase-like glycosyltransferase
VPGVRAEDPEGLTVPATAMSDVSPGGDQRLVEAHPFDGPETTGDRILFALLVTFILGWYLLPSSRALANRPHDLVFWLGLLPVFLMVRAPLLWRLPRWSPVNRAAAIAIGWMTLSTAWSTPPFELGLGRALLDGLSTLVFVVVCTALLNERRTATLERLVAAAGGALAVASLIGFSVGLQYAGGRLKNVLNFEHPNLLGHSLGIAALLGLRLSLDRGSPRRIRIAWGGATVACLIAIGLTLGRTPGFAVALGIVATMLVRRRRRAAVLLVAAGIVCLGVMRIGADSNIVERGDSGRAFIWTHLVERTADRPLIGAGLRASDDVRFPRGSRHFPRGFNMPHAHSLFVGTYYRGGLIGLALLISLIAMSVVSAVRSVRRGGSGRALPLLLFGILCLIPDGHRLVSNPHLSSWLVLWLPIALATREGWSVRHLPASVPGPDDDRYVRDLVSAGPPRWLFVALAVVMIAQRLVHFGPDLDLPHVWRQSDTAHYARDFAENGLDLLHPAVCWMGPHRTLVLECPLPEAVVAVGYRLFGVDLRAARAVTLLFFLLSAWFFERLVAEVVGRGVARWALLGYLGMPLSLFFSRAVHIDFAALAFAHGMAWCWVRAVARGSRTWLIAGVVLSVPAVLVKAPYAACLLPVVALVGLRSSNRRRVWPVLPLLLVPVAVFIAWQVHALRVNASAPDWSFIPTYRTFVHNSHWYFGGWRMRLNLPLWGEVMGRLVSEGVGLVGLLPVAIGTMLAVGRRQLWPVAAWLTGMGFYLAVFFNLNVVHDYYQIPFLAPLAVCLGLGLSWLGKTFGHTSKAATALASVLMVACAVSWIATAEHRYYGRLEAVDEAGLLVRDHTPPDALVIVSFGGLDCRSPHVLYPAHRDGWSIPDRDLAPELLDRLRRLGAGYLLVVQTLAPSPELAEYLHALQVMAEGRVGDHDAVVYRLVGTGVDEPPDLEVESSSASSDRM